MTRPPFAWILNMADPVRAFVKAHTVDAGRAGSNRETVARDERLQRGS